MLVCGLLGQKPKQSVIGQLKCMWVTHGVTLRPWLQPSIAVAKARGESVEISSSSP